VKLGIPLLAAAALASCNFNPDTLAAADDADPNAPDADPNAPDADPAALPDATPACALWQAIHFDVCILDEPIGGLNPMLDGTFTYDTTSGELRGPADGLLPHTSQILALTPPVRAIVVDSFKLGPLATLVVTGTHPLLIASWDEIEIEGTLDVSSPRGGQLGAGANPDSCGDSTGDPGDTDNEGGGGGGGGGLGGDGGDGGDGDDGSEGGDGGSKGDKLDATPSNIRGGCSGGGGGDGTNVGGGNRGGGGGAVYLVAQNNITVAGILHAGGAGGEGGDGDLGPRPAGGAGGSGGYIGLEAATVTLTASAVLAANGGGGGGGANNNQGGNGDDGPPTDGPAAQGGTGEGNGGDGGDGGIQGSLDGGNGQRGATDRGGGGAGGGVGFIIVNSANFIPSTAKLSPPAIQP
jgi:hypothetical protein